MKALGERLYAAAVEGDWTAAKLLLAYAVGRAPGAVDADRLDLQEWEIVSRGPTAAQCLRLLLDGVDPKDAAEVFKEAVPQGAKGVQSALLAFIDETKGGGSGMRLLIGEREARIGK
jgi:hypothetical protein